jgi:radical SAM superfamily enzyme YgiQ (UPF0313 family)
VDIGVESTCDIVLESLSKGFKLGDVIKTADLLKRKKMPATWFIILGAPVETRETVSETLNSVRRIISKWDLVFISTGVRVYKGSPYAGEMVKKNSHCTHDNFLRPVKIEPEKISLEEIHAIAKSFSYKYPNYYFYEKEHITPGWLLITGNFLLKILRSRQPVWRLLILLRRTEKIVGLTLLRRIKYKLKNKLSENNKPGENGFSLISTMQNAENS